MPTASYSLRDWNETDRSFRVVASTAKPIRRFEWNPQTEKLEEYWEALEGWNFRRFEKNPLVFESHNTDTSDCVIGTASDFRETEDGGLEMKITLAPTSANERTAVLEQRIKQGLLRGVSVGWEYGARTDEERGGRTVRVYRGNILLEVSLVPIPADEDALVEADADDETRAKERVSNAGRLLAQARKPRSDAREDGAVARFDFIGRVGKFERTQVGGIRVKARLTRTGILEYRRPDGTIRRELRLPEEVFNTDSLATLHGAPVTDLANHRALITPDNWRAATRGHTEGIRKDGKYVEAELVVNDADTVRAIERGDLHDISCGYVCKLDFQPGVYEGQPYDAIQRNIRYNHVAVLPKGVGRAGTDVALRLDAKDAVCVEADSNNGEEPMRVIRIDGKDVEYGSEQHIKHIEEAHLRDIEKFEAEKKELQTKLDKAEGEKAVAKKRAEELEEEERKREAEEKEREEKRAKAEKARARKLARLATQALRLLSEDDEDEEKMDARLDKLLDLSERDLMIECIRTDARWKDADFEGRGDEYVQAIFDAVVRDHKRVDGIDSVVRTAETVKRSDARETSKESPAEKARREREARNRDAWKQPLGVFKQS